MYNYEENMKEDIKAWIEENISIEDNDVDYDDIYESLWIEDSVTGNGSGSYTFNREEAKEYVVDNMELCQDALREFCTPAEEIGNRFLNEDWEWLDVTIRCYLLGQLLGEVFEEMGIAY